jgi:antagonist of KipI
MGVRVIKSGMADSLRDAGRYGFQHLGIPPGGAMDSIAMQVANLLVGNPAGAVVLEMHYPAPQLEFNSPTLMSLSGADFQATMDGVELPLNQPCLVSAGSVLKFVKPITGARCYLAVKGAFEADEWLGSKTTNEFAKRGGFQGRNLQKGDWLAFSKPFSYEVTASALMPWTANVQKLYPQGRCFLIPGPEYDLLDKASKHSLIKEPFQIAMNSNRMGYRLQSAPMHLGAYKELLSSGVDFGTLQLLPNAQTILLMADHQTTAGYPRLGHVASVSLPTLAQLNAGDSICFQLIDMATAESMYGEQEKHLRQLKNACNFRLQEYLSND